MHGTTLALNTVIQRSGARTGLLVTSGFADILELQRLRLPDPHHFNADRPRALVMRRHVREIDERVLATGDVYRPLAVADAVAAARELQELGVEALASVFCMPTVTRTMRSRRITRSRLPALALRLRSS